MKRNLALTVGVLALVAPVFAQDGAPRETVNAVVGGSKVAVEYGRPSLKGRPLTALLGQLPADKVWRAGSEQVTTLTTDGDIMVGGKKVAAGKYSVYVHVAADGARSLVLNSDPGVPLGQIWAEAPANLKNEPWPQIGPKGYAAVADKEVARIALAKAETTSPTDPFTIKLTDKTLNMAWGNESWTTTLGK